MIAHVSFSVSGFAKDGLNAKWLPQRKSYRPVKKAEIWMIFFFDGSEVENEKVSKKKSKKKHRQKSAK